MNAQPVRPSDVSAIALLLRDPREVARRCLEEEGLRSLALASLIAVALGAAVFGAVVGSFRGSEQIFYGAVKVPIALLGALVICIPAFHAIAASLGRAWPLRTVIALTMAAAGRAALVLLASAPVLWLAFDLGLGYHASALAATAAYGLAGLAALGVLLRGLGRGKHAITTALAFVAVFLAAGGQTGWILRPYLVRPQSQEIPFLRSVEGSFADAVYRSSRSAAGVYDVAQREVESEWPAARSRRLHDTAYDDTAYEDAAYDDTAYDVTAYDDAAYDDTAYDDTAYDDADRQQTRIRPSNDYGSVRRTRR